MKPSPITFDAAPDLSAQYRTGRWLFNTPLFDVYAGTDLNLQRDVHLRFLVPRLARNADVLRRFSVAAREAAGLLHPNLLAVYDIGTVGNRLCVITEALPRLSDADTSLPLERVRRLALDCLAGLEAAHDAGVVHGDIADDAIFLAGDDSAKLADVGLFASACEADPRLWPRARAPGNAERASVDGDLYALALALTDHARDVPVGSVLTRAASSEPAARYRSAAEFAAALQAREPTRVATAPSIPVRPEPETTPREAAPPRPSTLARVLHSGVVAVVVAVAFVAALFAFAWNDDDSWGYITNDPPAAEPERDLPPEIPR